MPAWLASHNMAWFVEVQNPRSNSFFKSGERFDGDKVSSSICVSLYAFVVLLQTS